jgi:hypothetical protein
MRDIFARSNTYRAFHSMYGELGAFGTGVSIIADDFENVLHHYPLTAGEYCIATDFRGNVTTLYREFQKTVHELVGEFGYDACSATVKRLHDSGNIDQWVTVVHAIEPRADREIGKLNSKNKPWRSVYFEAGRNAEEVLSDSGFDRFPVIAPRWDVTGGDIYGSSPAMDALGDVKQLQQEQLRKGQGIDYKTKPPLQMPTALRGTDTDSLPGGIAFLDAGAGQGIRTQFEVNLDLSHLLADIQDVRGRINSAFYADLFLMLSSQVDSRMTATEVAERHEEKLLMLGPVLERLHNEMLSPMIEITFERMMAANVVPPPPPALNGAGLNIEFVSMLAQAQQAVGVNSIDRFVGMIANVSGIKPDIADKLDSDYLADAYSDALGVDPELIVPSDKVALVRQARAQQAQQAQQAQSMTQASQTARNASQIDPKGLQDVINMFSGYTTPPGA